MGLGRGTDALAAFQPDGKQTAYPTTTGEADALCAVLGAGDLIPFISEGILTDKGLAFDETLDGGAAADGSDVIWMKYGGPVPCQGLYQGLGRMIACALGYEHHSGTTTRFPTPQSPEAGTATGGSTTTLVKTGAGWGTNDYAGYYVRIYEGAAADEVRLISSNTTDTLTIENGTAVAAGSLFEIGTAWLHKYECDSWIGTRGHLAGEGWIAGRGLIAGDKLARRGTLGIAPQRVSAGTPAVREHCATMFRGLRIEMTPQALRVTATVVPFYTDLDSGGTQDPTTWTLTKELVAWPDWTFRVDDYSTGTALSGADELGISSFTLEFDGNLATDDQDTETGLYIAEPERNGPYTIRGSFMVPRYVNDTLIGKFEDDTPQMFDLKAVGPVIAGSDTYKFEVYGMRAKITAAPAPINGPGLMNVTYNFTCEKPPGVPKDFPTSIKGSPLIIQTQDKEAYNAFRHFGD